MENTERKPYEQPAVVYETDLEARAGTPEPPFSGSWRDSFGE